jgi:hypothetical protein
LVLVEGVGLQRGQHVLLRELVLHVQDVTADGAGRQRAFADGVEFLPLAEVERDGDDLGIVALGQPGNRDRGVEAARVREDDSLQGSLSPFSMWKSG